MRWIWWVIGALAVIGFYILLFALAAACDPISPEDEIECLREQEKERRRKHEHSGIRG